MRYALDLLELLLVEGDIVVLCDVLKWLKQIIFHVLFALLLLDDDGPLEVEIVLFF